MEIFLSILAGLALSAACGFRVFVPLLVVAIAARTGHLSCGAGFEWLASDAAWISLSVATVLEIVAYYVPCVDNFVDALAIPVAGVAGAILTASFATDVSPWLQWMLGVVAGGGVATAVHAGMATIRGGVTALTGGMGNGVYATGETALATGGSLLAVCLPVVGSILILGFVVALVFFGYRFYARRRELRGDVVIPGD